METFVTWCSFIGAWLLFAGPIYQAALELRDEEIETEHFDEAKKKLPPQQHISAWWWLLPPIKVWLEHRSSKRYRKDFIAILSDQDIESIVSLLNKATGWLMVATGGLLIAINETYGLVKDLHWLIIWFWVIIIGLGMASVANTAYRIYKSERVVATKRKQRSLT